MSKLKLSHWHDGKVNPVHVGVYQVNIQYYNNQIFHSFWNGNSFGRVTINGVEVAFKLRDENTLLIKSSYTKWRGILK